MKVDRRPIYLPALKGRVGAWLFYTVLMKFSEVDKRIRLSDEIYENKGLSDMIQRTVKKSRVGEIANYLKSEEERFFPAMVVAVFDGAPNWLDIAISKQSEEFNIDLSGEDISKLDSFGILELNGQERLFPLDGQHRLAGIREALEDPGVKDKYLGDDEIVVMLVAHEQTTQGRTRSRRLFTVLNKRAVPVKKHETIALDEDDAMAIVTRHLVEHYEPLMRKDIVLFRTNASIPGDNSSAFTTIVTLYDMLFELFRALANRTPKELRFNRPADRWLRVYVHCAEHFFRQMMATFPEVGECLTCADPTAVITRNRRNDGGHILFRPVGQKLIAYLVSEAIKHDLTEKFEDDCWRPEDARERAFVALEKAFNKFSRLPTDLSEKPYANLIWSIETEKMQVGRATVVRDVILKRYQLLQARIARGLDSRLRASVGRQFSTRDFLW